MGKRRNLQGGVLEMERVRNVLQLSGLGFNQRAIARATGVARSSLQGYLRTAEVEGITYERAAIMTDSELREAFKKQRPGRSRTEVADPDFEQVHKSMMSRKGVTLELLWKEWRASSTGEYSYSTFCRRYHEHIKHSQVVMRQAYTPGELLLSDYTGATLSYWERDGEEHKVEIFVACLGFSNLIYAEASRSQTVADWTNSHIRAFSYCGGVTSAVIIDNLKSGVTKSDRYEPDINKTFQEFGEHYSTTIFAVRARKPRDKAKVEQAVQQVERDILAPLRNRRFTSLEDINIAIAELLEQLNSRTMKDYGMSRRELFTSAEKGALKTLPALPFVVASWKRARVGMDYHIEFQRHRYSVPYYLARKEVMIKSTEKLIEVFCDNERVASHRRSHKPYEFSTIEAHMPPQHLAVRSWTEENFVAWAQTVGEQMQLLVRRILETPRFRQQSYRSILGIQRVSTKAGAPIAEAAATRANERGVASARAFKQILEFLVEKQGDVSAVKNAVDISHPHDNIRGSSYYH
jgi:transposase